MHWKLNSMANVALNHTKKSYRGMRCVSLEMAPHWCRCWETALEQKCTLPAQNKLVFPPPPTQPNSCLPHCKCHLQLTFNDSFLSPGRRVLIDPKLKGFPTSNHLDILQSFLFQHLSYKEKGLQLRLVWNLSLSLMKINNLVVTTWFEFWRKRGSKTFAEHLFQNTRNTAFSVSALFNCSIKQQIFVSWRTFPTTN